MSESDRRAVSERLRMSELKKEQIQISLRNMFLLCICGQQPVISFLFLSMSIFGGFVFPVCLFLEYVIVQNFGPYAVAVLYFVVAVPVAIDVKRHRDIYLLNKQFLDFESDSFRRTIFVPSPSVQSGKRG